MGDPYERETKKERESFSSVGMSFQSSSFFFFLFAVGFIRPQYTYIFLWCCMSSLGANPFPCSPFLMKVFVYSIFSIRTIGKKLSSGLSPSILGGC